MPAERLLASRCPLSALVCLSVGRGMDGLSVFSGASSILGPREAVVKELQAHVCFSWSSSMCPHVVLAPRKF